MKSPTEMLDGNKRQGSVVIEGIDKFNSNKLPLSSRSDSTGRLDIVDKLERLKFNENSFLSPKSMPSLNNETVIEETDDALFDKHLNGLNNARDTIRKLSTVSSSTSSDTHLRTSRSHVEFTNAAYDVRMLNKDISNARVNLEVQRVMIIVKKNDPSLIILMRELVEWLLKNYPDVTVYVEDSIEASTLFSEREICDETSCKLSRISYWNQEFINKNDLFFDLCLTLGGDGTVLFASTLFQQHVPPILSFSLGSLGFLTNFDYGTFKVKLPSILNQKVKTNLRMRLEAKVYHKHFTKQRCPKTGKKICYVENVAKYQVLNEVTIDRGPSPFISMLELYGDGSLMTVAQADGLIIATPTGSTAYSLSAGGSLIYPSVNAIAVTPICPHTLSFRPIVLPDSIKLKVKVPLKSRSTAWVAFDGKNRIELTRGDYVTIESSPFMLPTIESSPTEFIDGINRTMNWNIREQQKSFTHILSKENRERFVKQINATKTDNNNEDEYIETLQKAYKNILNSSGSTSSDGENCSDSDSDFAICGYEGEL